MDIQAAIQLIEESPDYEQFSKLKKIFKDRIEELKPSDFTEKGVCYYYLLRIILRSQLMYEPQDCRDYFETMTKEFKGQYKKYVDDRNKFHPDEIRDFFKLIERSYGSLEIIFRKKDFFEEEKRSYIKKMEYRQRKFWFQHRWMDWFEYAFLGYTSRYGNSFIRWGATAFIFAVVMAWVYYAVDLAQSFDHLRVVPHEGGHWYDYFYFSISSLTTLGIGDFTPPNFVSKFLVSIEVFFGFIMLGIFIGLIQKRL